MPSSRLRIGRRSIPYAYYTLTSTVAGRRKIFTDPASVECVIEALRCSDREKRSHTLAWVVMPDHIHWLMQLREENLSRCMQMVKSRAARAFNLLHGTEGKPVWQRGFYDHCLPTDESLHRRAQYLAENPVRAGLVTAVEEYPYQWTRWCGPRGAHKKSGTPKSAASIHNQ